jgi:hypothetical protein
MSRDQFSPSHTMRKSRGSNSCHALPSPGSRPLSLCRRTQEDLDDEEEEEEAPKKAKGKAKGAGKGAGAGKGKVFEWEVRRTLVMPLPSNSAL